jgi:hypothetical protein
LGFLRTDTPRIAVEGVGMPEIVRVWVDLVLAWIRLDQHPVALAGLAEESPVAFTGA